MKVTGYKKIECFCPLGKAWYVNKIEFSYTEDEIVDFCDIDKQMNDLKGKTLTVEAAVDSVKTILHSKGLKDIHVSSYVDDAVHFPVKVETE